MKSQIPGFAEVSEWPVQPELPFRVSGFGRHRDPQPHCTFYLDLIDKTGRVFHFFFDRFLGRLCFGKIDDDDDAAFLKKGSRIQVEVFEIIGNLCNGHSEYAEIQLHLDRARNYV